jgi:hypothetical protein
MYKEMYTSPVLSPDPYMHRKRAITVGPYYAVDVPTTFLKLLQIVKKGGGEEKSYKLCIPDQSVRRAAW